MLMFWDLYICNIPQRADGLYNEPALLSVTVVCLLILCVRQQLCKKGNTRLLMNITLFIII